MDIFDKITAVMATLMLPHGLLLIPATVQMYNAGATELVIVGAVFAPLEIIVSAWWMYRFFWLGHRRHRGGW